MKNVCLIILALTLCISSAGCSTSDRQSGNSEAAAGQESGMYKAGDFAKALELFDVYLKNDTDGLLISRYDILQTVNTEKLTDRYYLVSYRVSPVYPLTNSKYVLADIRDGICTAVNPDSIDYIDSVSCEGGSILFYCDGKNVVNGFRDFPHNLVYDIEKKEFKEEPVYLPLGGTIHGEAVLGNFMNRAGIKKIEYRKGDLFFDFGSIEGTVLAGGMFCPRTVTGIDIKGEGNAALFIDMENTSPAGTFEKDLESLVQKGDIAGCRFKSYTDVRDTAHFVIYLELKGTTGYTCNFKDDDEGFMDMTVKLK